MVRFLKSAFQKYFAQKGTCMEHEELHKKKFSSPTFIAGLAVFSMLFGAGNLILPVKAGTITGYYGIGLLGFLLSSVGFPLLGLWGIVLFDGDYQRFFYRLGKPAGNLIIGICMLVVGPIIGIPRMTVLLYSLFMKHLPFTPPHLFISYPFLFTLMIIAIIFIMTYRENDIIRILARYFNPPLLSLLTLIIITSFFATSSAPFIPTESSPSDTFYATFSLGYQTLDLLAMLFVYSFTFSFLKKHIRIDIALKKRSIISTGLKAGLIGLFILTLVYIGMLHLGHVYRPLSVVHTGQLFDAISRQLFGMYGSLIMGAVVVLACLSTGMALSAIVAEWLQHVIFNNAINFKGCLLMALVASIPFSTGVLDSLLHITSGPLTIIGYPVLITITVCNILYKTIGFKSIKIPTALAFIVAVSAYLITHNTF
jgi:LIVCS family branched-chain amino acid:cation transporter